MMGCGKMFRAQELISALIPGTEMYSDCVAAIKFDLGEIDNIFEMAKLSIRDFFKIPAPLCLFQFVDGVDLNFFIAKEVYVGTKFSGTVWNRFCKQENDGFRWAQEDMELFIGHDPLYIIVKQISTDTVIAKAPDDYSHLPQTVQWAINLSIVIAMSVEVFSCSNVTYIEHAAPKFLNSKRERKGKVPFFSYRTLHITGNTTQHKADAKSSRTSPRLHFRRGHIRRLANGTRVWVTGCLAGDKSKGFAAHDYSAQCKH